MTTRELLMIVAGSALAALVVVLMVAWFVPVNRSGGVVQVEGAADGVPNVGYAVPAFELTDQSGAAFGRDDLAGKVWVANFIFTRCPGPCPILSTHLAQLRDQLAEAPGWDRLHLVSFSVDPEYDRPEVLRAYAERYGATPDHWAFLTGERAAVWPLIEGGFKLEVSEAAAHHPTGPITHSNRFVLVDQQGQVRGYYDGLDAEDRAALLADVRTLAGG